MKQRGLGSSLQPGYGLRKCLEKKTGENYWCGERSHKSHTALTALLSSPSEAQVGLWVSCANGAPWEKGKAPHSVCADGQSLVSGGVGSSRTSSAFSSLQRAQWKTVKQWDFCDCNLNTCNLKKKNLLPVNSV